MKPHYLFVVSLNICSMTLSLTEHHRSTSSLCVAHVMPCELVDFLSLGVPGVLINVPPQLPLFVWTGKESAPELRGVRQLPALSSHLQPGGHLPCWAGAVGHSIPGVCMFTYTLLEHCIPIFLAQDPKEKLYFLLRIRTLAQCVASLVQKVKYTITTVYL